MFGVKGSNHHTMHLARQQEKNLLFLHFDMRLKPGLSQRFKTNLSHDVLLTLNE